MLPQETGRNVRPTLTFVRVVLELFRLRLTLKYGLSCSAAADSDVIRRRRPAGVSQSRALIVSGQASRPRNAPPMPLYGWLLSSVAYWIDASVRSHEVASAWDEAVTLMRSYFVFGTTPLCWT